MANTTYVAPGLLIYTVVTGLLTAARNAKAKSSSSTEVFGCTIMTRSLVTICIIGFAIGSIYVLVTPPSYPLGATVFGLIAIGGLAAYPMPITLTPAGIEQFKWWGSRTTFRWSDVVQIEFHKGPATTVVVGRNSERIAHTGFHVASDTFRSECVARTHLKIITTEF